MGTFVLPSNFITICLWFFMNYRWSVDERFGFSDFITNFRANTSNLSLNVSNSLFSAPAYQIALPVLTAWPTNHSWFLDLILTFWSCCHHPGELRDAFGGFHFRLSDLLTPPPIDSQCRPVGANSDFPDFLLGICDNRPAPMIAL